MRRLVIALAAAALLATTTGPVEARASGTVLSQTDASGDIRPGKMSSALSTKQLRSIDIRSLTMKDTGKRVRVDITFPSILIGTGRGAQQLVKIELRPVDDKATWESDIVFTPQRRTAGEGSYYPTIYDSPTLSPEFCLKLPVTSSRQGRVTIRVPKRCLPGEAADVRVLAKIGRFNSVGGTPVYARDELRVPGSVTIPGGTITEPSPYG